MKRLLLFIAALFLTTLAQSAPWVEVGAKRTQTSKTWQDTANRKQYFYESIANTYLHYDGGLADPAQVDCKFSTVNAGGYNGWRMQKGPWNFFLGQPAGKGNDGWVGFGGRQGQNWLYFRLGRAGYMYWVDRSTDIISGTPSYNRANLSITTKTVTMGPAGSQVTLNILSSVTWHNIFTTPNGGELYANWFVEGKGLKEEIVLSSAARSWIAANRPPSTPAADTYFSFIFVLDASDIPQWKKNNITQNISGDFDDDNGTATIVMKDASQRDIGFMPIGHAFSADRLIAKPLRKRLFRDSDGTTYLIVGLKVGDLNAMPSGDVIFDPTTTIQPTAPDSLDTFIADNAVSTNYYNLTSIVVGDAGGGTPKYRMLLRFDLSSIAGPVTVSATTVSLYEFDGDGTGTSRTITFSRLLRNWYTDQASDATWTDYDSALPWTTAGASSDGADYTSVVSATLAIDGVPDSAYQAWVAAQLTSDVSGFINGTVTNHGWRITSTGEAANLWNQYYSGDWTTAAQRPKISVTYTANTIGGRMLEGIGN